MNDFENGYSPELEERKHRKSLLKSINFYNQIENFADLLQIISQNNFHSPKFLNYSRGILCLSLGIDSSIYSLKGIVELCEIGDVIDAFVLVRKIRDNLYLDLFFINEALNNRPDNYKNWNSFENMNQKELEEEMIRYAIATLEYEEKNENIQNINRWLSDEYSTSGKQRENVFSFSKYKSFIESKNQALNDCHTRFLKPLFSKLNESLNNYVHSNAPSYFSNAPFYHDSKRYLEAASFILSLLNEIKRLFLIDLFLIDSTLFQTDDYSDAMELGIEPEKDSQYKVVYQVLEEFDKIKKDNPELYEYLKSNNRFRMKCFN